MSDSTKRYLRRRITLNRMKRLKNWHAAQHQAHPIEYGLWETVVTLWLMGWIGWMPALAFEAVWAYPLCLLGILGPQLYVHWRTHAHASGWLRCDWLELLD